MKLTFSRIASFFCVLTLIAPLAARAQQTLGSINGAAVDQSNAVVVGATVEAKNVDTGLVVTAKTENDGSFSIKDLPIGTYELTVTKEGFKKDVHTQILVRGNLTTTVNSTLQPGDVSSTVTVTATPLMNQTDTTNGYTLGNEIIQSTPLGTGSFTQLAILAPGVNADLLSGSGTNTGMGNQNISANGQRYTSNSFTMNAITANNLFNGNSSSQVSDNRLTFNTGESFQGGGLIFTGSSVFDAIGEALPSPPPETIEEVHVNTSMYDASQGANSGAHIELTTKSGTNTIHGGLYEYHQTTGWNANPFFFNADGIGRQPLHRNAFGGTIGGPIIHNKAFFFGSYQGQRAVDNLNGISNVAVPPDLTDDRSPAGLATVINKDFIGPCGGAGQPACFSGTIDSVAQAIMCAPLPAPCTGMAAPKGGFFIPSANNLTAFNNGQGFATTLQGQSAKFNADQLNGNVDYDFGTKDRLAAKYYYQRDPTTNPFAESSLFGFPQTLRAGSQVVSIDNTTQMTPNFTWEQRMGFIRETAFSNTTQPNGFSPSSFGMNLFGSPKFPSVTINHSDDTLTDSSGNCITASCFDSFGVGPLDNFANAGFFQNAFQWASTANWVHGIQTFSFGGSLGYTQLNIINQNNQVAFLSFNDFPSFLQGFVKKGVGNSTFFDGASNRYYRSYESGLYAQDDIKIRSNLSVNAGLRFDWDGPLSEKHGQLDNFSTKAYSYDLTTDTINNIGLVVAGNNKALGTKGVGNSTLTGRQWGLGPRIGFVYSPQWGGLKNFVVRTGYGIYYDRGEFFTELSPSAGSGFSGPFGVTLAPPFVQDIPSACPSSTDCFANPFPALPPPATTLAQVANLIPCQGINAGTCSNTQANGLTSQGLIQGTTPFLFGSYDRANKLPYSENWTLDVQWQPYNTLMVDAGYVGNHGVHETLPIPFNQPFIASPNSPVNGQLFSYGYNVPGLPGEDPSVTTGCPMNQCGVQTFDDGNVDLRAPFLGYSPNSIFWEAEGISHYNALQLGVNKRLSHGLLVTGSYTWSHSLDEGSGLSEGLFFNGNDPRQPRTAYGNSAFDRTHVFTVSYLYQIPDAVKSNGLAAKAVNGWGISGITVAESGQPYSVSDFSGSVASIFYSMFDNITNPLVPLAPGKTIRDATLQGTTGVNPSNPVLNKNAFGISQLIIAPNSAANPNSAVPPCATVGGNQLCDNFEMGFGNIGRDIFRGPFQTRFDFSVFKNFKINERFSLKYDAQFFNIFNHPSFDTPNNNVSFNSGFCNPPTASFSASCPSSGGNPPFGPFGFATVPSGRLGVITHALGSPRFIQMALHLTF